MVAPLPDVPDLTWFQLEIMYYLMGAKRYGNEMRLMLNEHLGEESVTTGKLYPILKKLEKSGYIKRLKVKKSDIEQMEKGMINILTRGVERIYFEITEEGIAAVEKALHFASCIHFNTKMSELNGKVRERIEKLLSPLGDDITIGIVCSPMKQGVKRAVELIPEIENGELIFLVLGSKKEIDMDLSMEFNVDVSSFPSKFDDIPLKGSYLDAVISTIHFIDVPNPQKLIKEMSRTVKPGGQVIIIDYVELDSVILEDMFQHHIDATKSSRYQGEDMEELVSLMEPYVVKIHSDRFKELMVLHGKRSKKRSRE